MARYLVTGGCGFIGSHLVDVLVSAGHQVAVLDDLSTGRIQNLPPGVEMILGDVASATTVARAMAPVDGCFHLAAIASTQRSNEAWLATHRSNVGGTVCVLEAACARRVPVVFASSAAIYGDQGVDPIDERAVPRPRTAYGADKLGSELHARVAGWVHHVPTVGLRFFNVYGPRQDPRSPYSGVISIFIDRLLAGATINIHGDGLQVRDFVFVRDVVRFLLAGMRSAAAEPRVFNVGTGSPTTVRALAATIADLCERKTRVRLHPARIGDIRCSVGDTTLAAAELGVRAEVGLGEGLRETIIWCAAARVRSASPRRTAPAHAA